MVTTVGIAGLGLIGGSMAKAIHKYTDCTLLGYDTDGAVLSRALDEGIVSAALTADRLADCELVIVALYPQAAVEYVIRHRDQFRKGGIVMDCGGVKGVVCGPLEDVVKDAGFYFVGGHPMAGIERSGYANAFPELFQRASLILTPYPGTPQACLDDIWEFARKLGFGHLQPSTPQEHDHIIAYTSQLAHVVSCAYVGSPSAPNFQGFSAGSFKDMTRVAKLNEEMWTELFLENKDALVREIDTLVEELAAFAYTIRRGDRERLRDMLRHAREIKEAIDKDC
ncbi:MAG: prephenate dehydrogenase/arogenate dehydrogenase family protein [Oscillospiraceae bacterium]|nr:prephenate dehydrogenase/arogenate dehydrogenase family protein [Oscillospiraceae bacterium]